MAQNQDKKQVKKSNKQVKEPSKVFKKLTVGHIKDDTSLAGLYFSDDCFSGIPKSLRISVKDFNVVPEFEYSSGSAKAIPNSVGSVSCEAYNNKLVNMAEAMKNEDSDAAKQFYAGLAVMDINIIAPPKDTKDYEVFKSRVLAVAKECQDSKHVGQDLLIEDAECHVMPKILRGKGNYNKFQGTELGLFNFLSSSISFANPVDL